MVIVKVSYLLSQTVISFVFADDASVLITHAKTLEFKSTINKVFRILADWFKKI
jgi:hypothetical protein